MMTWNEKKILPKRKYCVKWAGYELKDCTWEPADNFDPENDIIGTKPPIEQYLQENTEYSM